VSLGHDRNDRSRARDSPVREIPRCSLDYGKPQSNEQRSEYNRLDCPTGESCALPLWVSVTTFLKPKLGMGLRRVTHGHVAERAIASALVWPSDYRPSASLIPTPQSRPSRPDPPNPTTPTPPFLGPPDPPKNLPTPPKSAQPPRVLYQPP